MMEAATQERIGDKDSLDPHPNSKGNLIIVPTIKSVGPRHFFANTRVWIRILQWVFSLLSFALLASIDFSPHRPLAYRFALAIAIVAWVIEFYFILNYIFGWATGIVFRLFEAIYSGIWTVLWFAAATAVAAKHCPGNDCGNYKAAIVFMYLTFGLYLASSFFAVFSCIKAH